MGDSITKQRRTMTSCSVCLEPTPSANLVELTATCQHEFCPTCLVTWFNTSLSCPKCRQDAHEDDVLRIAGRRIMTEPTTGQQTEGLGNRVDEFTLAWLQENDARQCPRCNAWIVRSQGCNDMKCHCNCRFNFGRALFARDWDGHSPPLVAAYRARHYQTMEQIFEKSANMSALNPHFQQTFASACEEGEWTGVRALLQRNKALLTTVYNGHTPLYRAIRAGQAEVAEFLFERDATLDASETACLSVTDPVFQAMATACRKNNLERVRWMLRLFPGLANEERGGRTLLHHACERTNLDIVNYLLEQGADKMALNEIIVKGCQAGNFDQVHWMLGLFPALLTTEFEGHTHEIIAKACQAGNFDQVRWMLGLFPALLTTEFEGHTPLYYACDEGNLALVEYLLDRATGANVCELCYDGVPLNEAVAQACQAGNMQRIRWMLRLFPVLLTTEYKGQLPMHYAHLGGHETVVAYLDLLTEGAHSV